MDKIFTKILCNSATEAEKESFYSMLEKDETQREYYSQLKNLYSVASFKEHKDPQQQERSFQQFWNKVQRTRRNNLFTGWYRYAAVIAVAFVTGFMIQNYRTGKHQNSFNEITYTSEKGSVSTIHLNDGSDIWISSGSNLTISGNSEGEMTARLNGEAYFDLVPDPDRKFSVDLGYFKVKDIGTKFNIRSYGGESGIFTTLVEGKIDLYKSGDKPTMSMKPGEFLHYNKQTAAITVTQVDPSIATAWKDGKFVFINKTLREICLELENWYNVQIIINNKSLAETRYTSVIKRTTSVSMVLKMLSLTDIIKYKIEERKEGRDIVYIF